MSDSFISNTLFLFFILDPIALSMILPSILKNVPEERRKKVIIREMFFSLAILLLFFFLGSEIVSLLGLQTSTLSISGAIVLFLIALGMVFPTLAALTSSTPQGEPPSEPFIVPIAVPLIVGPSSISIVMIQGAKFFDSSHNLSFVGSICAAWGLSLCILLASRRIIKALGRRGSVAMERLTGILLILLSVQMFLNGIQEYDEESALAEKMKEPVSLQQTDS